MKLYLLLLFTVCITLNIFSQQVLTKSSKKIVSSKYAIHYYKVKAADINIFYRESGAVDAPVILLLHGYPTSSFMFRNLIPILSTKYHVIAPDLPGFGFSDSPDRSGFNYTFDNLSSVMQAFIDKMKLKKFAIYIFDYGAPVGLRLALANPEKITGIISQNGNAYKEGLSSGWNPIQKYWSDPSVENRAAMEQFVSFKLTRFQYEHGVADPSLLAPETYVLDQHFLDQSGQTEIQLDLLLDYRNNIAMYPIFQEYFRKHRPKFLAVWGQNDPYFLPAGAIAFKKDNPNARVKFYPTGHFALETHVEEIGRDVLTFMQELKF